MPSEGRKNIKTFLKAVRVWLNNDLSLMTAVPFQCLSSETQIRKHKIYIKNGKTPLFIKQLLPLKTYGVDITLTVPELLHHNSAANSRQIQFIKF